MKLTKKELTEAIRSILKESEILTPVKPGTKEKTKVNPLTPPKQAPRTAPKGMYTEGEKSIVKKIEDRYNSLKEEIVVPRRSILSLVTEGIIDKLEAQYVGDPEEKGKISQETFDEIVEAMGGNHNYVAWLANMVSQGFVLGEDVYKFKQFLEIFNKNKQQFPIKNIFDIKTSRDIRAFMDKAIEIEETGAQVPEKGQGGENLVSPGDIQKLKAVGIPMIGMVDGYQVFEIPTDVADNEETWKVYKNVLARCAGRGEGEGIHICTMANFSHFKSYVSQGDTYVFFNMSDPKSPYQMTYEANMFKDKDDRDIF